MKLYRIIGHREYFKQTGKLPIDHVVSSNLTELKKTCTELRALWRKTGLSHTIRIESIETFKATTALLVKALSAEDTELLVKSRTTLQEWKYEHTERPTESTPRKKSKRTAVSERVRQPTRRNRRTAGKRKPQRKRKG